MAVAETAEPKMPSCNRRDVAPMLYQRVKISGLKAKPELNGAFGKCVTWSDERGRYAVQLEGVKEAIALKPENLAAAAADEGSSACLHCGSATAATRCTRCFSVWYCSEACRKLGWAAHGPHCVAPPIAEHTGSKEMSHEQHAKIEKHMQAAIDAGRSGSASAAAQEIKMLKQSAAADPHQPATWFNLAQAYRSQGSKAEAVEAMAKAVFYMLQVLEPGKIDPNMPGVKEMLEKFPVDMCISAAQLLEDAVVGRSGEAQLRYDVRLGQDLQTLADKCGARLHPGARSLCHYVYGNVLRKLSRNDEAAAQLRSADAAAWNGGKGERDLVSLSTLPEVLAASAQQMGLPMDSEPVAQRMGEALVAARAALEATPRGHPMRASVQLCAARMISNRIITLVGQGGAAPDLSKSGEVRALRDEGIKHARQARDLARGKDPRLVALTEQILSPNQALGTPAFAPVAALL